MPEYIVPRIKQCYEFQGNHLQCWGAVALTMWRWKHGRGGAGASMDSLFRRPGGRPYADVIDFSTEVSVEILGNDCTLAQAASNVRQRMPQYRNTPTGLPDHAANGLFTWLGCSHTAINRNTTAAELKTLITTKGPIAIFTRNPGHLQIIVGYWESDPTQPQVIIFNPEKFILQLAATGDTNFNTATIREDRWLWPHWQAYFASNLVAERGWHF